MAYTASALSFLIQGLKAHHHYGSQLPVGVLRTDATENLLSALEFAAMERDGAALIQEVCIYFEYKLYRGTGRINVRRMSLMPLAALIIPLWKVAYASVYDELLWKSSESELRFRKP